MRDWADEEFEGIELGDKRRRQRMVKTARALAERPGCTIPQACASWADTEGAYRLFENEHVSAEVILNEHFQRTALRASQEPAVVVIADGSEFDFSGLKATEGLGYLSNENARGLDFFAVLVANGGGQPLGLIDAKIWARDSATKGKTRNRAKKATAEKESQFWLNGLAHAQERLPVGLPFVYVADAEADMFDLFAAPRREGVHLLVRAGRKRIVDHPAHLLEDALRSVAPAGSFEIEVGRGGNRREGRKATLTVRFERLWLLASKNAVTPLAKKAEYYAILAEEEHPPEGVQAIHWVLLTTLPVTTLEEAKCRTEQYAKRWLIERYFYTLKSGCRVEELQLATADQLIRAAALFAVVGWRLLWLMHESRLEPHEPCTELFSEYEWKALYAYHYPDMALPAKPPTLREALRLTAKLGGFLARRGDGEPGIKTVWLGLSELERLARLYRSIAKNPALCQSSEI